MTLVILTRKMGMQKVHSSPMGGHAIWPYPSRLLGTRLRLAKFASCHTPMLTLQRTISVTAMNQGTSQQGEPSNQGSALVPKVATVSSGGAELKGLESESVASNNNTIFYSTPSSNKDLVCSEQQVESAAIGSKKLTEQLTTVKNWWKAVNEAYCEDSATWGYGSSPIFTVYLGPNGQIERVSIDEDEIQRRQAAGQFIPGLDNDGSEERAQQKIMLARSIAKDLETGKRDFNRHSTVFAIVQHASEEESQIGHQKLLKQIDVVVHKAAPALKWTLSIAIPLYGLSVLFGAYLMATKRSEEDLSNEEKSAARLEQMRNLKAQMNAQKGNTSTEQPPLAPSEFMQKILEVREMARKVRSEEGVQKSDSDLHVEEYQPEEPGYSLFTPTSSAASNVSTEQGQGFDIDMEEYQPEVGVQGISDTIEGNQATLHNLDATDSTINVTPKPARKVRPRIITSLDEAMAVLGSNQPNDAAMAETVVYEGEPQTDCTFNNAANRHDDTLPSTNSDSILRELRSSAENSQTDSDRYLGMSSQEQVRVQDNQSTERYEGANDNNLRHGQPCVGTPASTVQSTEVQTLEPRDKFEFGNGRWDESQVLGMTSDSQVEQLGHAKNKHLSDEVFAEVVSSTGSEPVRTRDSRNIPVPSMKTDEVVGSGQPLLKTAGNLRQGPIFSGTKQWSKELHRKYNSERDPEIRELMKEIGSELDSWLTEEEIEETARLVEKLEEGDDEYVQRNYTRVQRKIKEEKEKFGLDAVLEKYKEFQPKAADKLWWLDLRCVLCLMVATQEGEGLYGLDMTLDMEENTRGQVARHVIAFEDRKDASSFCRLLELRSDSRFQVAEVQPYSPKELLQACKEENFQVTVLRSGQIKIHVDQTLEEVEDQIVDIGRSVYWDELEREHSIDVDSILHQRFGL